MKKGISLFELMFCCITLGLILSFILLYCIGLKAFATSLLFFTVVMLLLYTYIIVFSWKGMPLGCMYNPLGYIEIHVENICAGKRNKFMRVCLDALIFGISNNKNMMIDTWLIRERHIKELFGTDAEIYNPSIFQKSLNQLFMFIYKNEFKKNCFRCIINVERMNTCQKELALSHLRTLKSKLK